MRISYHEDTNSLYVHLKDAPTLESEEIAPGTVAHFDEDGNVTGIEIYYDASEKADLSKVEVIGLEDGRAPTVRVSGFAPSLQAFGAGQSFGETVRAASEALQSGRLLDSLSGVQGMVAHQHVDATRLMTGRMNLMGGDVLVRAILRGKPSLDRKYA